jgi:hypothetical protein
VTQLQLSRSPTGAVYLFVSVGVHSDRFVKVKNVVTDNYALTDLARLALISPSANARTIGLAIVDIVPSRLISKILRIKSTFAITWHIRGNCTTRQKPVWIKAANICSRS